MNAIARAEVNAPDDYVAGSVFFDLLTKSRVALAQIC